MELEKASKKTLSKDGRLKNCFGDPVKLTKTILRF